jgi:hypothetical protein
MTWKLVQGSVDPVYIVDATTEEPVSAAVPFPVAPYNTSSPLHVEDTWDIDLLSDVALNDSDKSITVPSGYFYHVLWVYVKLVSSAIAGNRQMAVGIYNALGNLAFSVRAGTTQAASLTRYYAFAPALADLTAFRDTTYLMTPLPPTLILKAGQQVRIWDSAAIDAAADDMDVWVQIARRTV